MEDNFSIIQIVHTEHNYQKPVGITVDAKYKNFLFELFKQYGEFSVAEEDGKIVITTK